MFVDNFRRRQPGDDTRDEDYSRNDDPKIIDLAQPKEKVRNRVDGRHDVKRKERRKSKLQRRNAFVSKESPGQPELIAYTAVQ
jgi:hypothetical protein